MNFGIHGKGESVVSKPSVGKQNGKFGLQGYREPDQRVNREVLLAPLGFPYEIPMQIGCFGEFFLRQS